MYDVENIFLSTIMGSILRAMGELQQRVVLAIRIVIVC